MPAFARLCALCSTVKPHGLLGYGLRFSCELSYHYSFIASPRRFYRLVRRTENNWTRAIRLLSRRSAAGCVSDRDVLSGRRAGRRRIE